MAPLHSTTALHLLLLTNSAATSSNINYTLVVAVTTTTPTTSQIFLMLWQHLVLIYRIPSIQLRLRDSSNRTDKHWDWRLIMICQLWVWLSVYIWIVILAKRCFFSIKTNILYIMTIGTQISQETQGEVITVIQTHMKTLQDLNITILESLTINYMIADDFID